MNTQQRIASLEKELVRLKQRVNMERIFREFHAGFGYRCCVRCNRRRAIEMFSVIFTQGKGRPLNMADIRFHSYCNQCRNERKKQRRGRA